MHQKSIMEVEDRPWVYLEHMISAIPLPNVFFLEDRLIEEGSEGLPRMQLPW